MGLMHSPNIVRNGLVLYLDAANTKSYPGSGTTWSDLSGNANTGTLVNGPTFNSSNGGSIAFDGTNDHVDCPNMSASLTASFSISIWFNPTNFSSPVSQKFVHTQVGSTVPEVNLDNYNGGSGSPKVHFYTAASGSSNNIMTISDAISNGSWYNVVGTYDNSLFFKYLYLNGSLKDSKSTTVKISWPNTATRIGRRLNDTEPLNGRMSNVQIYNRALSATEVSQNFNALRGRYGL